MRAVVHDAYGSPEVLRLDEVPAPVAGAGEILVEVHATTVNRTDCGFRQGKPFFVRLFSGLVRPKHRILGTEFAGVVVALGPGAGHFHVGERVFGVNADHFGAHAQLLRVAESAPVARMPAELSFEEAAAACDGAVLARTCLTKTHVGPGTKLLIYGATGAIGSAAVQLAADLGADVTAVCATPHLDLVRALGAQRVIDYTAVDFTRDAHDYDVVLDAVGKSSFRRCRRLLKRDGIYASTDLGFLWHNPPLTVLSRLGRRRVMVPIPRYSREHVVYVVGLVQSGAFRPVIDRKYRLDEIVAATRFVETGQKVGNVVITVADDPRAQGPATAR